jgi:hypothetical protein
MQYPHSWDVFPLEGFATAAARSGARFAMELMAQARPNGRIIDHFRVALGGCGQLDVTLPLRRTLVVPAALGWNLKFQIRPRDVELKRNMVTSDWSDVVSIIKANDATVENGQDEVIPVKTVLAEIAKSKRAAAVRFGAFIAEDHTMMLGLQCLPSSADSLKGKPALRG